MKLALAFIVALLPAYPQLGPAPAKPKPPRNAKEGAPVDFTGYWVSVVTEDWRWRMVTPIKGDFASIPLTPEGRKVGNAWDPAKDEVAGEQCKIIWSRCHYANTGEAAHHLGGRQHAPDRRGSRYADSAAALWW